MWPDVAGAETHGSPSLNILKNMVSKHVFWRYLRNGFVKSGDFLAGERSGAENLFEPRIDGIGVWEVGEKRGPSGKMGPEFSFLWLFSKVQNVSTVIERRKLNVKQA